MVPKENNLTFVTWHYIIKPFYKRKTVSSIYIYSDIILRSESLIYHFFCACLLPKSIIANRTQKKTKKRVFKVTTVHWSTFS